MVNVIPMATVGVTKAGLVLVAMKRLVLLAVLVVDVMLSQGSVKDVIMALQVHNYMHNNPIIYEY